VTLLREIDRHGEFTFVLGSGEPLVRIAIELGQIGEDR
jgi:hypothetical protein